MALHRALALDLEIFEMKLARSREVFADYSSAFFFLGPSGTPFLLFFPARFSCPRVKPLSRAIA